MFDIKSVPKIVIRDGIVNNVNVVKVEKSYILYVDGKQYMVANTNTDREIRELYSSYDLAKGNVLITGFGFGILAQWLASKPEVQSVKVIDWSQDVVNLYLKNNNLPNKVSIEIANAKTYKTDIFYDCILLDHFQDAVPVTPEEVQEISKNIPNHSFMWFWSLEDRFTKEYYSNELAVGNFCNIDTSQHWEEFKQKYKLKFPEVSQEKLSEYVKTWFKCKDCLPD